MTRSKRNEHLLLDGVVGWPIDPARMTGIVKTEPDGYLRLSSLPGTAELVAGPQEQLTRPTAIAIDRNGRLLVTDAAADQVKVLDAAGVTPLPAVGGNGRSARNLRAPYGLAALPTGAIVVSDTGNHRVQMFSAAPYALLQVWDTGLNRPWGLAIDTGDDTRGDTGGVIHIVDRGNHRVVRVHPDGRFLGDYGGNVLTDPTQIACGPGGTAAVVDGATVTVFPAGRKIDAVASPRSVAFDSEGLLYIGDAQGLIYKFAPDPNVYGRYNLVWYGAAGLEDTASILNAIWDRKLGLVILFKEPGDPVRRRIWTVDTAGAHVTHGVFLTKALDSGLEKCSWHRIQLAATVPDGTSVEVETFTAESGQPDLDAAPFAQCLLAGIDNPDGLVQSDAGRQLWMRVTLRSDGKQSPEIRSIQAYFPRDSYLKYLPAVYQEDGDSRLFLDRFLSIFQTSNDDWDSIVDNLWQLFDPMATPAAFFPTLANWIALEVDPAWSDPERRSMLRKAMQSYAVSGTVAGIQQAIEDYAGVRNARVAEDFKFRHWAALPADGPLSGGVRLWSRDVYGKLQLDVNSRVGEFRLTGAPEPALEALTWGAHRFRVFFPAGPYDAAQITRRVREVVEREKPAHTEAAYCPMLPRLRVGVQATVGVDAFVGDINYMVLSSVAATNPSTLNYDTILASAQPERDRRSLGLVPRPRVGVTAAIL